MDSVSKVDAPDWITPATHRVVNALGGDGDARFVGGCARNTLISAPVRDIDIATVHTPDVVMNRMRDADIKAIPTGIDHGTVTAVIGDETFEITTLRRDVATDGRRAVVAFSTDWHEDAQRRDFTMNTLLMDTAGYIYDPTEQGLDDLRARRVVFVGDPAGRIAEDVLRILRFFRFHAYYGDGMPDDAALKACAEAASKIDELSRERITQEMFKILSLDDPTDILKLMFDHGVLADMDAGHLDFLSHVCGFQNRYNLAFMSARMFALAGCDLDTVRRFEKHLLLPNVFKKDMQGLANILALPDLSNDHAVKVAVYKYGRVGTAQALMIELARDRVMNGYALAALDIIQNWNIPNFPVSGEDLIAQGMSPGKALGDKLRAMEQAWIDAGFKDT